MTDSAPDLFPPDEPPTFPHRTSSNEPIRFDVIRPMIKQYEAGKELNEALAKAVKVVKAAVREGSIPPPPPPAPQEASEGK